MQRVRLHNQSLKVHSIQQLPQRCDLTTGIGGVGVLSNRHAERLGIEAHLGNVDAVGRRP